MANYCLEKCQASFAALNWRPNIEEIHWLMHIDRNGRCKQVVAVVVVIAFVVVAAVVIVTEWSVVSMAVDRLLSQSRDWIVGF